MSLQTLVHEEVIAAAPEALFATLHTPAAIRKWWGATSVIVVAQPGGYYVLAWGDEEDPTHFACARIKEFAAPHRLLLADYVYYAKDGRMPIDADFAVTFEVAPCDDGACLRVIHDGFPPGSDDFYRECVQGWADTCASIKRFLAEASRDS